MYTPYEPKQRNNEGRNKSPTGDFFRTSLKSKEDLSFLKHRQEQQPQLKVRQTLNKPDFNKFVPRSSKVEDRNINSSFKSDSEFKSKYESGPNQWNKHTQKKNNAGVHTSQSQTNIDRKGLNQNMRPEVNYQNGNSDYQKLHDKLNYLQNKITEMRSNLQKKRQEKKKYFEKQIKERQKITQKQSRNTIVKQNRNDPLKQVVSQVSYKKNLKSAAFDPYSPRHNTYYVSEIVRAYKEENSLAREHLVTSIQLLKMLSRSRIPSKQQISSRSVKFQKKSHHQDKKTVIFDLDQTLIHCNQNANMPCDVKLPVKFPTGQIIYAGINIRPYAVELLKQLSKNFQVIVFTASHSCYANVVLNYLDPENKYISHRLFRQHCYYTPEGVHVKDLRVLNRDLSQTILIDNAAYSYAFQIQNGVPIIPYYQGKVDFELKALQVYLESMIFCKDVREVNKNTFCLHRYVEFDNPENLVKELYPLEFR